MVSDSGALAGTVDTGQSAPTGNPPGERAFANRDRTRRAANRRYTNGTTSARDTSIAAAKTNLPLKGSMRRTIVQTVVAHYCEYRVGMTCAELEARLRKTHQTVSSAVNYAETAGWIRDSGQRKLTPSKAKAIVWEPTEAATTAIKEAGLL
jgi:hypothetical protein